MSSLPEKLNAGLIIGGFVAAVFVPVAVAILVHIIIAIQIHGKVRPVVQNQIPETCTVIDNVLLNGAPATLLDKIQKEINATKIKNADGKTMSMMQ
ncbi:unnamed protein product, partial [Mesorhabditis spiculigera]